MRRLLLLTLFVIGCGASDPHVPLAGQWPDRAGDYDDVTRAWTRRAKMRTHYQEALDVSATFKSPEWRAAYAARDAELRGLRGPARDVRMTQARAEAEGPYEIELLVTTWDRRENDLDRGKRSVWRVRMLDEQGMEIEPLEIVKDKRPAFVLRSEFPDFGDFATAYIVRFPREKALLGPGVRRLRLHMSNSRGGVQLEWQGQ